MAARSEAKRFGLSLTLPGAPSTYHTVQGVLGYFHPERPTPVGGPGEISLEIARRLAADPGMHLDLVEMTGAQADEAAAALREHRRAAGRYIAEALKVGGAEGQIARDELAMSAPTAQKED